MYDIKKRKSASILVLLSLIPYSKENYLLTFKPGKFFKELASYSNYNEKTLKTTYYRGVKQGYITPGAVPRLTYKGLTKVQPFIAKKIGKNARLMLIFDVPEAEKHKRQQLRNLIRNLRFEQIQKSVWVTDYDHKDLLAKAVDELGLKGYVELFECARIYPK